MNFTELGLSEKTIKAIDEVGVSNPTTVQISVNPSILSGKDVFAIAPPGCGKTCSYVFPLIDIISSAQKKNVLIITPDSTQSVIISDQFALFNKYHEEDVMEDCDNESSVIIASPDILVDMVNTQEVTLSDTNILVVDDINLIKKNKQLSNLEQILQILPADKQNIIYTNRRYKETQDILDKILKTPQEIKVDKNKEKEAEQNAPEMPKNKSSRHMAEPDKEAMSLVEKNNVFKGKTPTFLLYMGKLVDVENKKEA